MPKTFHASSCLPTKSKSQPLLASISNLEKILGLTSNILIPLCIANLMFNEEHRPAPASFSYNMASGILLAVFVFIHALYLKTSNKDHAFTPTTLLQEKRKNFKALCLNAITTNNQFVANNSEELFAFTKKIKASPHASEKNYTISWQPGNRELELYAQKLHQLLNKLRRDNPVLAKKITFPALPWEFSKAALFNPLGNGCKLPDLVGLFKMFGFYLFYECLHKQIKDTNNFSLKDFLCSLMLAVALLTHTYTTNRRLHISQCEGFSPKALQTYTPICFEHMMKKKYLLYPSKKFEQLITFIIQAESALEKINENLDQINITINPKIKQELTGFRARAKLEQDTSLGYTV